MECFATRFCLLGKSKNNMIKSDIITTIQQSNISAQNKNEIIAIIKKSNIPTSEKKEIIQTINTGTKEEILLAIMHFLCIAKDLFDKFIT